MNSLVILLIAAVALLGGYLLYGRFLAGTWGKPGARQMLARSGQVLPDREICVLSGNPSCSRQRKQRQLI